MKFGDEQSLAGAPPRLACVMLWRPWSGILPHLDFSLATYYLLTQEKHSLVMNDGEIIVLGLG
jgi:hypothetical protein